MDLISIGAMLLASFLGMGALLSLAYVLLARLIVGESVTWGSAFLAGVLGVVTYLAVIATFGYGAYALNVHGGMAALGVTLFTAAAAMGMVNKFIVRKKSGGRISFPQGFMLQVLPSALFFVYWYNTRPNF